MDAPEWLRFGLEHRSRFEHLENDFRAEAAGDSTALLLRTFLSAEVGTEPLVAGAELQDSRAYATDETPLNTSLVNAVELLQAYGGLRLSDVFTAGDRFALSAGRFTLDIGSRRLVSRSDYRNVIAGFTGLDVRWNDAGGHGLHTFFTMPVIVLPSDAEGLSDNAIELDRENTDAVFWGVFYGSGDVARGAKLELYVLGLHERDHDAAPSPNRRVLTPGVRVFRAPTVGELDFQVEGMLQLGESRATSATTDRTDLSHRAFSTHLSVGYRLASGWTPRLAVQYDYATGDSDPDDGVNNRFDALFGDRRFEFGPTGIYGAFARSNISSPGARLELTPHERLEFFTHYRAFWLAANRDAWTTAGLRDPSGGSGWFIGHQLDARVRWHALPKNLLFELGAAHLIRGEFARNAPGGRDEAATYVYSGVTGTL